MSGMAAAAEPIGSARGNLPAALRRTWRAYRYWVTSYRRTWRGSVVSSIVNPVLYLAALGVGLGTLVHAGPATHGLSYLQFIAPGLLAATAMQVASIEATYPVLASVKWVPMYDAMLATPLTVGDVFAGHLLWMLTRIGLTSGMYLAVIAAFGGVRSGLAVCAVPICLLLGLACAAPIAAFAVRQETDTSFSALQRFVIVPMFLFSGTFFSIDQLPSWIRPVAYVTPLWHGVTLTRDVTSGVVEPGGVTLIGVHLVFLVALAGIGTRIAARNYRRRLER